MAKRGTSKWIGVPILIVMIMGFALTWGFWDLMPVSHN